jgi:hypothetical protein
MGGGVRVGGFQPESRRIMPRNGADENWPDWYATYMTREQIGQEPP